MSKLIMISTMILSVSSISLAKCPYAKNLQTNSQVGINDNSSNFYNVKFQPTPTIHSPAPVKRKI